MIKILPDNIKIENPCDDCGMFKNRDCSPTENPHCHALMTWKGVLSILSQAVEVDIDDLYQKYHDYIETEKIAMIHQLYDHELKPFSQFLQEKMNTKQIPNVIKGKPFTVKFL